MPSSSGRPPLVRLRILLWHARPFVAVGAVLLLALGTVRALAPPAAVTQAVLVTSRDVTAGTVLSAGDLTVARYPPSLVPQDAVDDDAVAVGRRVAVDLPAGLPVTGPLVAGERFTVQPPEGTVVVPVRLATASTSGLLRAGDRIDLVAAGESDPVGTAPGSAPTHASDGPAVLARSALVLDVDQPGEAAEGLVPTWTDDGRTVAVAVTPTEGRRLASVAVREALGAVLVP